MKAALIALLLFAAHANAQTLIPRTPDDRVVIVWGGRTFYQPADFVPRPDIYSVEVRGGHFVDMGRYVLKSVSVFGIPSYVFVPGPYVLLPETRTPGRGSGYIVNEGRWTDGQLFVSEWGEWGRSGTAKYFPASYKMP